MLRAYLEILAAISLDSKIVEESCRWKLSSRNVIYIKGALQSFFSRKVTLSIVYIFLLLSLLDMRPTACMRLPVCGSAHTHGYCM